MQKQACTLPKDFVATFVSHNKTTLKHFISVFIPTPALLTIREQSPDPEFQVSDRSPEVALWIFLNVKLRPNIRVQSAVELAALSWQTEAAINVHAECCPIHETILCKINYQIGGYIRVSVITISDNINYRRP